MGDQRILEDRLYFSDKTSQAWQLRVHYHYCVFILIISPHPERLKGSSGHSFQFSLVCSPEGQLSRKTAWMHDWNSKRETLFPDFNYLFLNKKLIFYTESTGLSALCCWVAGALQQGLLWFQVAFWNRKRATPETAKPQWDQPHSSFNPGIGIIIFFLNTELYQNTEEWFALFRSKSPMKLNCQGAEHSTELSSSVKLFWTANINTIHLQIHQNSATHNEEESADTGVEIDHVDKNI